MSELLPVVIGGDIGAYALARQLNMALHQRVTVLGSAPIEAITLSDFIDVEHLEPGADPIAALKALDPASQGKRGVVMANTDMHAEMLVQRRNELTDWVVPFPSQQAYDAVCDKASFSTLCKQVGVTTPREILVDFAGSDDPQWQAPDIDIPFPVVAKAAVGADYDNISFPGKRKIWFINTQAELDSLWEKLRGAGFTSTFLVQELIAGDNTAMRSITAYMDSHGKLTMIGSARVLLEDHAPTMIGNPVAMIVEPFEGLWAQAEKILKAANYRGFANFDVKIAPDGREVFFEVNARIGRNSFYMTAGGVNPMGVMLADLVEGEQIKQRQARREVLYSLVPTKLLLRYLRDESLRNRVRKLAAKGVADPLRNPLERSIKRKLLVEAQRANHYRKFARYYPKATDTSF